MPYASIPVLVVDDSVVMRRIIVRRLREIGIVEIHEAAGVKPALDILAQKNIGLILSDWAMPGRSGMDLLRTVRGNEIWSRLPFVLLTAEAQLYTILMAYRHGVSQFVTKPFTREYFKYIIDKVIRENYGATL